MRRLLFYSQDGTGLGHLRRALNISREVLLREPSCAVLVVGDSPAIPFFAPPAGVDFLKLPTIVKTGGSDWRNGSLAVDVRRTLRLRERLIAEAFSALRPDVVLVDHMPVGAQGELRPMLERAASDRRVRLFLGLRDVLDAPSVIHRVWRELGAYDVLDAYEAILVYGCREIYDTVSAYELERYAGRIAYCGYATRASGSPVPDAPAGRGGHLVVTGGGGGDSFPLLWAFVEAFPLLDGKPRLRAQLVTGPNMPAEERAALVAEAGAGVEVHAHLPDTAALLDRAAAVVTMGGYNSLCEVLRFRRRALVVPRAGPSAEQRIRSRLFAARGLVRELQPEALTAELLARELAVVLHDERLPDVSRIPPLDGAARAAELILGRE